MIGLQLSDFDDTFEVWPDNWKSFLVMDSMWTQWRIGASGPTGLDYGVLPDVMRLAGIPASECAGMFQDIRIMESEAIAVMAESRQRIRA